MKSPAQAEALKPLRRLETEARAAHAEAMAEHQLAAMAAEMATSAAQSKAKAAAKKGDHTEAMELLRAAQAETPAAPVQRRYITTNATTEALAELLRMNPTGLLAERDEVAGLLRTMGKEGNEELRAFYLQGYDGASGFTFDRIGRGLDLHVPAVWLSLVGAIQPGVLRWFIRDAMRGGGGDDGLLQRFGLLVWPDAPKDWRNVDRYPDTEKKSQAFEVIKSLSELGAGAVDDDGLPLVKILKFDEGGQRLFDDWRADLERELRAETLPPAIESHLAKYRKVMPTLSLLCAVADGERDHVTERHALQGAAWCTYLRSHAERMYQAGSTTATEGARLLLRRIREGRLGETFTARDVRRRGWSHLTEVDDVAAALELLTDLDHLHAQDVVPTTGRRTVEYHVNPLTIEGRK
jgi:putative DNA primase/helicase